ncbi:MAG: ABC transporter permease [Chloroflexi bacterium]|nr:ABC transporter permease [Chloroflexota bacterium]MYK61514.1 ABC transporter permease [Chloroflexota bacterium]
MGQFIARRVLLGIIALMLAMLIVFSLSRVKGDPRYFFIGEDSLGIDPAVWEEWGRRLNLDKPVPIQFALWMGDILTGDFGDSVTTQRGVLEIIREKAPNTIQLGIIAWLLGTLVGVPLGVFSATNRGNFLDYVLRGFALFGQSVPIFWLALVMIFVFAVNLGWLPSGTKGEGLAIRNFVMPAVALAWFPAASYLRITRTAMLEILDSEFVKFARAKGVAQVPVRWKHAFRNAIIPPLTLSVFVLFGLLNGTIIIETVFAWPGLGRLAIDALWATDYPLLAGLAIIYGAAFVVMILSLDIVYALLDPRIKYN